MSYVNKYTKSFENLSEGLKEYFEYLDKSEVEQLQVKFIDFLRSSISKNKVEVGKLVDWSLILCIFDNEVKKLVNKFEVPKNIEDSKEMINLFRYELLKNLEPHFFNYLELTLNDVEENLTSKDLNIQIGEAFNVIMPLLFRVFDIQFQLTSLIPTKKNMKMYIITF